MKGLKMRLLGIFLAAAACPLTFLMSASKVLVIIGILCYVMAPILFLATKGRISTGRTADALGSFVGNHVGSASH